jgi:hypothetical protein
MNLILKLLGQKQKLEDAAMSGNSAADMLRQYNDLHREYKKLTKLSASSAAEEAQIRADRTKLMAKIMELEKAMPKLSVSDFATNSKANFTDKELLQYATSFLDLTPAEMDKLHIGSGAFKDTYDIPGTGLVLKKPGGMIGTEGDIYKDYLANKTMEDTFPKGLKVPLEEANDPEWKKQFLERPKLIAIPEREPILIQKKLVNIEPSWYDKVDVDVEDLYRKYRNNLDELFKPEFKPNDLHSGNLGIDSISNKVKAFDAMTSPIADEIVYQQFPKFKDLIYKLKNPAVLKSIAPIIAKGAVASAGGLASMGAEAAMEALDPKTGNEDETAEVKAMREEEKERKFRKAHPEMKDIFEKADKHLSEFGPKDYDMQIKPEFRKLRNSFK